MCRGSQCRGPERSINRTMDRRFQPVFERKPALRKGRNSEILELRKTASHVGGTLSMLIASGGICARPRYSVARRPPGRPMGITPFRPPAFNLRGGRVLRILPQARTHHLARRGGSPRCRPRVYSVEARPQTSRSGCSAIGSSEFSNGICRFSSRRVGCRGKRLQVAGTHACHPRPSWSFAGRLGHGWSMTVDRLVRCAH